MALFSVTIWAGDEDIRQKIKDKIQEVYDEKSIEVNDGYYIISTNQAKAGSIAESLGMYDNSDTYGIVFRLNGTYAGFAPGRIWDWIDEKQGQATS